MLVQLCNNFSQGFSSCSNQLRVLLSFNFLACFDISLSYINKSHFAASGIKKSLPKDSNAKVCSCGWRSKCNGVVFGVPLPLPLRARKASQVVPSVARLRQLLHVQWNPSRNHNVSIKWESWNYIKNSRSKLLTAPYRNLFKQLCSEFRTRFCLQLSFCFFKEQANVGLNLDW
jgi:hypothetical protein